VKAWQAQGLWWLPGTPEKRVSGTLSCDKEGELRLSLLGSFTGSGFGGTHGAMLSQFSTMLGVAVKEGKDENVTLWDCFVSKQSFSNGELGNKQEFFAHRAFLGAHLTGKAEFAFGHACVSYSGLAVWADGLTGFSRDAQPMSLVWRRPDPLCGQIPGGTFTLGVGCRLSMKARERTLSEEICLNLTFSPEIRQNELDKRIVSSFHDFFTLATDVPNAMTKFTVSHESIPIENIEVVGPPIFADESSVDGLTTFKMLFSLADVRDRLERVFQLWLEISNRLHRALVVYFACIYNPAAYADLRFQQIMSALSLFHSTKSPAPQQRPTSVDQLLNDATRFLARSQADELNAIMISHPLVATERALLAILEEHQIEVAPLVTDKEGHGSDAFVKYAINTLAYTTTRERPQGPFASGGLDLHWLTERIAFLIKISLLKGLEFTTDQIATILKRNRQFRHIADNIQPTASWA
jgi:ApeA N-terminal domain 1